MTENGEPIHELGIQDAEGNFTTLAALDYDTVNDELSLKHLQQNVELRTDGTSWNPNAPLGDETQPVPGTSHFESVETERLDTNRSWKDVSDSRSFDVEETNTTDSEIVVAVTGNVDADNEEVILQFNVDGREVTQNRDTRDNSDKLPLPTVTVPPGSDYRIAASGTVSIRAWEEFRP